MIASTKEPQEVDEFESAAYAPAVGQPWQVEYNDSSSLRTAVDVLISLQDRLDDYAPDELAEAARAPDIDPEPVQEPGAGSGVSHEQNRADEPSRGYSVDAELEPTTSVLSSSVRPMANASGVIADHARRSLGGGRIAPGRCSSYMGGMRS